MKLKRMLAALLVIVMLIPAAAMAEGNWWNILLLGGDSRDLNTFDRTDTMIILSLNKKTSEIKLTSLMRDIWVTVNDDGTSRNCKLNAANVYGGPELVMETVNEYFGTDIKDYVMVNMGSLLEIIDVIGGIDLEVTESERRYINEYAAGYLNETGISYDGATYLNGTGMVHLNGLLALSYCRDRYSDSDYGRVGRQQKVIIAAAQKVQSMGLSFSLLMDLATSVLDDVVTNLGLFDIVKIANVGLGADVNSISQLRLPADGAFTSGLEGDVWLIRADFEKNKQILHDYIYGEAQ